MPATTPRPAPPLVRHDPTAFTFATVITMPGDGFDITITLVTKSMASLHIAAEHLTGGRLKLDESLVQRVSINKA